MARVRRNARAGRWRKHRRRQAILHARRTAAPQRTSGGPRRFRPASPRSIYCPVLPCCRGHDLIDQNRDRMGAVKTKHRAAKGLQPGFVTRQASALGGAVVIVRGPLEEVIGFIVPATSLASITQPRKADFGWRKQEHRKVEQSEDRVAPRVERTAQYPGWPRQEQLVHQAQPVGYGAHIPIGWIRRLPVVAIRIVVWQAEGGGQRAPKGGDTPAGRTHEVN